MASDRSGSLSTSVVLLGAYYVNIYGGKWTCILMMPFGALTGYMHIVLCNMTGNIKPWNSLKEGNK